MMRRSIILICLAMLLSLFVKAQTEAPVVDFQNVASKYAPGFPANVNVVIDSKDYTDQLCKIHYEIRRNGELVENIADFGHVAYSVRLAGDQVISRDVAAGHGYISTEAEYENETYTIEAFTLGIFTTNECVNRNRPINIVATFDSIGDYTISVKVSTVTAESEYISTVHTFTDCNAVQHNDQIAVNATIETDSVGGTLVPITVVPSYAITFEGLEDGNEVTVLPPARIDSIMQGDDYVFSIDAFVGCQAAVDSITVGGVKLVPEDGKYTVSNVQSDTTIVVTFIKTVYNLAITTSEHGHVALPEANAENAEVECGTEYTIMFVPDAGYRLESVLLDGEPVTEGVSGNNYTLTVLADHTIEGVFAELRGPHCEYVGLENTYEVGDTIDFSVKMVANCMYDNLCAVGYELIYWNTDTTNIVVSDATKYGVFSYSVNVTDDTFYGNQITNGSQMIQYAATYGTTDYNVGAFTLGLFDAVAGRDRTVDYNMIFTTSGRYQFKTTMYTCANGGDAIGTNFTVSDCDDLTHYDRVAETCSNPTAVNEIVADINVTGATVHTVTATVLGGHGTVEPNGTVIYEAGTDIDVVFTPDEYYALDTVMVNGIMRYPAISQVEYVVDNVYSIDSITENYVITVKYKDVRPYYKVHVEVTTAGGSVTPKDTTVVIGSDVTLRVRPNDGYHISQLDIDGNLIANYASNEIIFRNITEDHNVTISFFPNSIEDEMFADLSIYPNPNNGSFTVSSDKFDGDVVFQIYSISGAMMDEKSINGEKSVRFEKSLTAGTYFLRIIAGDKVATRKIVVE